jgi:hypothetical protein
MNIGFRDLWLAWFDLVIFCVKGRKVKFPGEVDNEGANELKRRFTQQVEAFDDVYGQQSIWLARPSSWLLWLNRDSDSSLR